MSGPSRRERLKPVEFVVFAGVMGVFTGLVVLLVTRDGLLPWIFGGIGFIATLVLIATLTLAVRPNDDRRGKGHGSAHDKDAS